MKNDKRSQDLKYCRENEEVGGEEVSEMKMKRQVYKGRIVG